MLYQLHEFQRSILHPISRLADISAQAYTNPYSPLSYLPFSKRMAATFDLVHRIGKEYQKPSFGLSETIIDGATVPIVEKTVLAKPFADCCTSNVSFIQMPRSGMTQRSCSWRRSQVTMRRCFATLFEH